MMRTAAAAIGAGVLATVAAASLWTDESGRGENSSITVFRAAASTVSPSTVAAKPALAVPAEALAPARARAMGSTWWRPEVTDTWQWQLTGRINTSYDVDVYDIDLFEAPSATIALLHDEGRKVVCYFSAGSSENWRPDFDEFAPADLGRPLDGWPGERWLDTRSQNVRRIMAARLDLAADRGCDGVEPDNMEAYSQRSGFPLSGDDQLDYNRFLATEAHRRGLAIGLKNDLPQIRALVDSFDFAVNEQCAQYRECHRLRPFTDAGKPVWNAEYLRKYRDNTDGARTALCAASRAAVIRTLVLPLKLNDRYRYSCD